jgi:hypothetical protein
MADSVVFNARGLNFLPSPGTGVVPTSLLVQVAVTADPVVGRSLLQVGEDYVRDLNFQLTTTDGNGGEGDPSGEVLTIKAKVGENAYSYEFTEGSDGVAAGDLQNIGRVRVFTSPVDSVVDPLHDDAIATADKFDAWSPLYTDAAWLPSTTTVAPVTKPVGNPTPVKITNSKFVKIAPVKSTNSKFVKIAPVKSTNSKFVKITPVK